MLQKIYSSSLQDRGIFLDRDNTLNEDPGYLNNPDQLKLLPYVKEALEIFIKNGFRLFVVTNQSGIGRGLVSWENLNRIHEKMNVLISPCTIEYFACCEHSPSANCKCRKPNPGLLLDIAQQFQINLQKSYMLGDRCSDILAGVNAQCRASVSIGGSHSVHCCNPHFVAKNLLQAAHWIVQQQS